MLLTTKFMLDDNQRNYLETGLEITQKQLTELENDKLDVISNINTLIKVLLTCNKMDDAWKLIEENLTVVDFRDIMTCPYMNLKRDAVNVYKYMHDNNIIDDKSYMYFEALSGSLNDWEFWKINMNGLSTTQKLTLLHESFNDIFVQQNVNPYELGLIRLTDDQYNYIFENIEENELIDFIFENKPCIDVDPIHIQELLSNKHLDSEKCIKYFNILFEVYNHTYDISDDSYTEFWFEFFNFIKNYFNKNILNASDTIFSIQDIFTKLNIDNLPKIYKIIDWMKSVGYTENQIFYFSINTPITLNYSYTIINYINPEINNLRLSDYLMDDDNLGFVLSYRLHPYFNTDDYIIKYPFPSGCAMIYSKTSNMITIGDKTKSFEESDFSFIDNYSFGETVDDELFKNFSSIDDYAEFILAAKEFASEVNSIIG